MARAIIQQSRELWLVADHDKFGRHAKPPEALGKVLKEARVKVVLAP